MKALDLESVSKEIKDKGFIRIENFLSQSDADDIIGTMEVFNTINYTQENLENRVCYKREESHNRQGDAFMVSKFDEGKLPSVPLYDSKILTELFDFQASLLSELVGIKTGDHTRSMMNCQRYFQKSLPVWDHYDGEFLDFTHEGEEEKKLILHKAILPRYVMVFVLFNENNGKGTYVRNHDSKERIDILNKGLDLIVFDNIKMRHGVPELDEERMMIGFRNFDFNPYYFERDPEDKTGFTELHDEINPGWTNFKR
jgi:hypothetical protein